MRRILVGGWVPHHTEDPVALIYQDGQAVHAEVIQGTEFLGTVINDSLAETLAELGDKAPAGDRQGVETAIASLREATKGDDKTAIEAATQSLAQLSMKLGEQLYKSQAEQGQAGGDAGPGQQPGGQPGGQGGDKVVDADFEEVDDDKKKQ